MKGACAHDTASFTSLGAGVAGHVDRMASAAVSGIRPKKDQQRAAASWGDGFGSNNVFSGYTSESGRGYTASGYDDEEVGSSKKAQGASAMNDAFLQSAYAVAMDEQQLDQLRHLKATLEADPLTRHASKVKAFGVCASGSADMMNILTSANVVMPRGKPESMPEFMLPVVRAVVRVQNKVVASLEALLRDLLHYDALVKPMALCLIKLDLASLDLKAAMGREGVSRLGLDKSKTEVKGLQSTAAFHAVWPVFTYAFSMIAQWDEYANVTMVKLGSKVSEAVIGGQSLAEALAPIGFHFQMFAMLAEDLHKGGEAFPSLSDVYESEAKGEFMTAHHARSAGGTGGIDITSKVFKDAVKSAVKELGPARVEGWGRQKSGAPEKEVVASTASTEAAAKAAKEKKIAWAVAKLKEATIPVPEDERVPNVLMSAWRISHPGECWRLGLRGVCDSADCAVCK